MSDYLSVQYEDEDKNTGVAFLNTLPDECPQCHHRIDPIKGIAFLCSKKNPSEESLEVIFRCPHRQCYKVFIGYYIQVPGKNYFILNRTSPVHYEERKFPELVQKTMPTFCQIYNQANEAESMDLNQVCGVGYRKALEFLVKDFLFAYMKDKTEIKRIKNENLGSCIKNRISNENIKKMAKRASWLGNDETHYIRKWKNKDLKDMKKLIDLTVYWMESELRTQEFDKDMPESK